MPHPANLMLVQTSLPSPLPKKRIARSTIDVSVLGFGASSLGNLYRAFTHEQAKRVLKRALELGIAFVDTAPHYGHGLSERRIGMMNPSVVLSTKVGRVLKPIETPPAGTERYGFIDGDPFEPIFDYSYDGVMRSFTESCRRLGREQIEILLVHDLGAATHGDESQNHLRTFLKSGYRALQALKASGQIQAIGLGVNEIQVCEDVMEHVSLDLVLLAGRYTLLEQGALDTFLPLCQREDVSVIIGGPFNSGVLVGQDRYDYRSVPSDIKNRVLALREVCLDHSVPLTAAALQFPLGHPCVVSVLPGMATPEEVNTNLDHMAFPIPQAFWNDLRSQELLPSEAPTPRFSPLSL